MSLSRLKIEARIQALKCQIDRIKIVTVYPMIVLQNSYIKIYLRTSCAGQTSRSRAESQTTETNPICLKRILVEVHISAYRILEISIIVENVSSDFMCFFK